MLPRLTPRRLVLLLLLAAGAQAAFGSSSPAADRPGDHMLATYFIEETARVGSRKLAAIKSLADWTRERDGYREQLREMLGLSPLPERTPLEATITGREEHDEFYIEKLHYQSMPGLYVTGNLYVPRNIRGKVPAILYVCGHANVKENGVSYGAKANYQHHGAWFARHGYVCLTIDTIQLGELEGLHHGTYREGMWWWNARGYTPAGVEAWNSIRALDYLQSRPEVDGGKLGMTGRSGGGAYTWWTSALDERVKVAVPVAGITDLQNHVVDGCVAGHCDCMFMVNTYRWDYARMAALLAPRPLLIANSDKDRIFPLDGVLRIHSEVAAIYELYDATDKLGLLITEGPHKDTQDLQVPAFRWFNRFLKGEEPLISTAATKLFSPQQLKVFATLPADQRTTRIHETFVPVAEPGVPRDSLEWRELSKSWLQALREKSFGGWPESAGTVEVMPRPGRIAAGLALRAWEFDTDSAFRLPLFVFSRPGAEPATEVQLRVVDDEGWAGLIAACGAEWKALLGADPAAVTPVGSGAKPGEYPALLDQVKRGEIILAVLAPRGIGPTAWGGNAKARVQIRRRFMLLGQTLESMRVWDIRRAVEALRQREVLGGDIVLHLTGERDQGVNALYASLFVEGVGSVALIAPPASHRRGPDYLNVLRFLDIPQAVALVAETRPVRMVDVTKDEWSWATTTARRLGWPSGRLQW